MMISCGFAVFKFRSAGLRPAVYVLELFCYLVFYFGFIDLVY